MTPRVFATPAGSLWLLLREEGGEGWERSCWCLNLESGEVRHMMRSISELLRFGWREWEEGEP